MEAADELSLPIAEIDPGVEAEDTASDLSDAISESFDPNDVRIDAFQPTIDLLLRRISEAEIDLNPDFQRKAGIWNEATQSRLIESLLVKIPLPAFYFDATNDEKWLVVDGLQRLITLKRFAVDETLVLRNLEFLTQLEGKRFRELARPLQRRIVETQVTAYRILAGTPASVKFTIFRRINTGGLPLSAQEIRHALNQGPATHLLQELADSDAFRAATDYGMRNERMADRECVLRFLTFFRRPYTTYAVEDFDAFLSLSMAELNHLSPAEKLDCSEAFYRSMDLARIVFGNFAFRKKARRHTPRPPVNKALFETWAVNLAKASSPAVQFNAELIAAESDRLILSDSRFFESISFGTGSPAKVHYRFRAVEDLLRNIPQK
jgi:hypothetical protein